MTPQQSRVAQLLAAGLAIAALTVGCGTEETSPQKPAAAAETQAADVSSPSSRSPAAATERSESAGAENRPEVLLLEGAQLDGTQFDFAATAGNDVLLWFWAPW